MSVVRRALAAALFAAAIGCATSRPATRTKAATATADGAARLAYEAARAEAWGPRRFKALYRAEVSPTVGAIGRGYLSLWWDGTRGTLTWHASAPLAGARGGVLRRGDTSGEGGSPMPGRWSASDLIAVVLGVPDSGLSGAAGGEEESRGVRLLLDSAGRSAVIDRGGKIVEIGFPQGARAVLEPGAGVPRTIKAIGPDGRARLTLESYGAWPEGEPPG